MDPADDNPPGLFASLRRIADSLLALVQNRCELFAVELQEEKLRTVNLLLWLGLALALGTAGLLVGLAALALLLWSVAGYAGLIGLALAALAGAAAIVWTVRRRIQTGPPPFAETVAEFKKDRECLLKEK